MKFFYERLGLKSSYYNQSDYTNDYDIIYCTINSILTAQSQKFRSIEIG